MRVLHSILFFLLVSQLQAQISGRLLDQIRTGEESTYSIYILLEDRVNIPDLSRQMNEQRLPLTAKPPIIIQQLQQKATSTQAALLSRWKLDYNIPVHRMRSYWVANMLFVELEAKEIFSLMGDPDIAWMDLNTDLQLSHYERSVSTAAALEVGGREPGLDAIHAPALWAKGYTGYGGRALVIDTGTDPEHPALNTRFWGNYAPLSEAWFDVADTEPFDCNDHGTHVCGTILGLDRLNDDTIGVAFNATWTASPPIACYRRSGFHGTERIIASFEWALNPDGDVSTIDDIPHVINNSWYDNTPELEECNSAYIDIFNALEAAGVAVVFSAGNEGPEMTTVTPPHNINIDLVNSFTVGALDAAHPNLEIADFSSRGPSICGGQGPELIKPEVSAPGVAVRSAVREGGYDRFSGTSMASPHVSGAILLLREAFPQLSGRDYKLALYNTAIDLGEPGEDNVYGRGIINVEAAYQYLIDQGNTPEEVAVSHDVMLIAADLDLEFCKGEAYANVTIENGGSTLLEEFQLVYSIEGLESRTTTIPWIGQLSKGERVDLFLPTLTGLAGGEYQLTIELQMPNQAQDERPLNNQFSRKIRVYEEPELNAAIQGATTELCQTSNVVVTTDYDGPGEVRWYNIAEGGTPIGVGPSVILSDGNTDPTIYMDVVNEWKTGRVDQENTEVLIDGVPEGQLIFDCLSPIVLQTVKVYADRFGPRNIVLNNGRGETIAQKLVTLTSAGEHRISLGFEIPEGDNYQLLLGSGFSLMHSKGEIGYPFEIPGLLTIKGSNDPDLPEDYYYYFYDWEIEDQYVCGRAAVDILRSDVGIAPDVEIIPSAFQVDINTGGEISFTGNYPDIVTNWVWNFGDGQTSLEEAPTHQYTEVGEYLVSLTVNAQGMCSNSDTVLIQVSNLTSIIEDAELENAIHIYPNPTTNRLFVSFELDPATEVHWTLLDILGRISEDNRTREMQMEIDLSAYPAGIYYLKFEAEGKEWIKKLIIQ